MILYAILDIASDLHLLAMHSLDDTRVLPWLGFTRHGQGLFV